MIQPLAGDFPAQVISQPRVTVRPLGSSTVARIPTNVMLLANGNNLAVHGDLRRRVVLVRLDAGTERPERRHFDRDTFRYTTENRGRIINAVLTLLLGFRAAGCPKADVLPFGGFPDWEISHTGIECHRCRIGES
jgi:putative DNA primase/helicase